ncbi:hypothetical protein [Rhodoferax ferrireducens]|uniref:hypothetical protein n=1 Tax=Rhodoferax ferrireducens TaxID=192843 RepID=UPI000E0D2178|nr:hypothetical protein [Rhodoferax ferrireducens]
MNELKSLETLGITLPGPMYMLGAIVFGIVGYAAYRYGKKAALPAPKWIGVALMLYPYAISATWLLYAVGAALCLGLYVYRK